MQETRVWFLSWEDPQEKGMAIQSSILSWRIPWTEELDTLQSMSFQRVGQDWVANTFTSFMYGYESWTIKKAEHQRIDAFELWCWGTLESPLDCKDIKPINPKRNQPWIFIGRTDAEAETPILWPPNVKNWCTGKDPYVRKYWRQEEKGMTQDEMVGWHHQLNGHEFGWTPGVGDGQEDLVCCSPWGCKESDTTEQLNWTTTTVNVIK